MAFSVCVKCGSTFFEVVEGAPKNSQYKLIFVQCSSCGSVINAMPYFDPGYLSKRNQEELENIKNQLFQIQDTLSRLQR
jgi:hydrogenase maturation factor HypF (carbamoyltransferase family)